jgi:hypothetical protein
MAQDRRDPFEQHLTNVAATDRRRTAPELEP